MGDSLTGKFVLDRYHIEHLLSRYPSGDLYAATDLRFKRRVVVLTREIPPDPKANDALGLRMRRWSQLQEPHLATIRDFGFDLGLVVVVLDAHGRETLADRLWRKPLTEHDAQVIVFRMALGLAALHDAGILHLHLDPTRILLEGSASRRVLLLPGLGLAGPDEPIPSRDETGADVPESPARYTAPEQLREHEGLTPAADVFSLAVVGLEMLLGRYPKGIRDSELAARSIVRGWARRRPERSEMGEVLLHALRHDPAERYRNAGALVDALRSMQVRPVAFEEETRAPAAPGRQPPVPKIPHVRWSAADDGPQARAESAPAPSISPDRRPPPSLSGESGAVYTVWYATNRRPRVKQSRLEGYGPRIDNAARRGSCEVFVPSAHMIGSLGSSWIKRLGSGVDDRLRLRAIHPLSDAEYRAQIRARVQALGPDERDAVVFIHGYNVSFEAAALRTAQLGFDLNLPGPIAFFSWPSRAGLLGYLMDGAMVEASEGAIAEFLVDFARNSGAERVHVIAHSMGNRGLLRAAQRIVGRAEAASRVRFNHLILAAPDVTRKLFLELASNYHLLAGRTTLYISDRDRALRVSRFLQGDRVGYAPPVTTCPGVDSVYVANVDRTFMGHSPFAESRPVLHDIRELICHDSPPEHRMGLRQISLSGDEKYWEIMR